MLRQFSHFCSTNSKTKQQILKEDPFSEAPQERKLMSEVMTSRWISGSGLVAKPTMKPDR